MGAAILIGDGQYKRLPCHLHFRCQADHLCFRPTTEHDESLQRRIVEGRGYGCLMDILLGLVGAFVGGQVVDPFFKGQAGFIGTLAVALIGALILIFAVRVLRKIV